VQGTTGKLRINLNHTATATKTASNRVGGASNMMDVGVYGSNPNLASANPSKVDIQSKLKVD